MRLRSDEMQAIKTAARAAFGECIIMRLVGSRVHDQLKGGDIDLNLEVATLPDYRQSGRFLDLVECATDGREIDTVFSVRGVSPQAFERIAYRDGIIL